MPTFTTPEPITATLTTAGARVRVTAGDRSDTVVRVEPVNSANRSDMKVAAKTEVDFTAGELSIKTVKAGDKNGSVAISVDLPAGSRLVVNTAWSDLHADGPLGDCTLETASGQVRLDHVTGAADVHNSAGSVRIGDVDGTVRYEGATGRIWIGHARSDVDLSSATGSIDIDRADGSVTAKAGHCPIRIGLLTHGQADLTNGAGGIEVGIGSGVTAFVDAESTKGSVRNSLPAAGRSDHDVKVYARTRRDDIVIHPAV